MKTKEEIARLTDPELSLDRVQLSDAELLLGLKAEIHNLPFNDYLGWMDTGSNAELLYWMRRAVQHCRDYRKLKSDLRRAASE